MIHNITLWNKVGWSYNQVGLKRKGCKIEGPQVNHSLRRFTGKLVASPVLSHSSLCTVVPAF